MRKIFHGRRGQPPSQSQIEEFLLQSVDRLQKSDGPVRAGIKGQHVVAEYDNDRTLGGSQVRDHNRFINVTLKVNQELYYRGEMGIKQYRQALLLMIDTHNGEVLWDRFEIWPELSISLDNEPHDVILFVLKDSKHEGALKSWEAFGGSV